MLEGTVRELVAFYNVQRIITAKYNGDLYSTLGTNKDKPNTFWKGYPCYKVYFLCNQGGILYKLGDQDSFSGQERGQYLLGRFKLAVDQVQLQAAKKAGMKTDFRHQRILRLKIISGSAVHDLEELKDRIEITGVRYNQEFGFDPDYNGF